jgi:phospholipid/cholesterol/gamma-HCH transport system substrate-binding protein
MTDRLKNILIGLFVVAGLTLIVSMVLFLEPTVGDGKKTYQVRFANIAGINIGTRVTYAGKPVGEVESIVEVQGARETPTDDTGRVYLYQLALKVDSGVEIYNTDEVAIRTTGLMGEKSVAILPRTFPRGKVPQLVLSDQILYANSVDPLENTLNSLAKVASRLEATVSDIDHWFVENKEAISSSIFHFDASCQQISGLLKTASDQQILASFKESSTLLNDNLRLLRTSLDEEKLLTRVGELVDQLEGAARVFNGDGADLVRNLNAISRDIATGSGTLGRFVTGDDFYLRLTSVMSKAETLMNDINHYGLLFQYDKKWQKSRTKRANLLKSLETPNEFRDYFEGEIDTIHTALGRLTELLGRAQEESERTRIVQSDAFKQRFAHLMMQVQSLADAVKLYNQELVAETD